MAQITELWPIAAPGFRHSFSAKTEAAALVTPDSRRVLIAAEDRTVVIAAEDRTVTIAPETRTVTIL